MILPLLFLFLIFLCWGSFLNAFAHRILYNKSLVKRSHCPSCSSPLAWYDLVPLVSFFILHGKCRHCKKNISWLYPFTEILTALIFLSIILKYPPSYWFAYFVFISALVVNTRTDLDAMVIPRITSICLVPFGLIFAYFGYLPISLFQSLAGTLMGYGILWLTAIIFKKLTHKDGLGEGDFELLALIGSFTGIVGTFNALFLGSIIGSIIGIFLIIAKKYTRHSKLPFGPLLALGSTLYILVPHVLFFIR